MLMGREQHVDCQFLYSFAVPEKMFNSSYREGVFGGNQLLSGM